MQRLLLVLRIASKVLFFPFALKWAQNVHTLYSTVLKVEVKATRIFFLGGREGFLHTLWQPILYFTCILNCILFSSKTKQRKHNNEFWLRLHAVLYISSIDMGTGLTTKDSMCTFSGKYVPHLL